MYLGELGGMSLEVTPKKVVLNVNTVDYTCMHCRLKWLSCLAFFLSFFACLDNGNYYLLFLCAPQQSLDIQTSWFRGVSLDPQIL